MFFGLLEKIWAGKNPTPETVALKPERLNADYIPQESKNYPSLSNDARRFLSPIYQIRKEMRDHIRSDLDAIIDSNAALARAGFGDQKKSETIAHIYPEQLSNQQNSNYKLLKKLSKENLALSKELNRLQGIEKDYQRLIDAIRSKSDQGENVSQLNAAKSA